MENACLFYIVCLVLKSLPIIIYKIQPPSLFISYLLFYIFLFNGFTQGDHVVSCTKMNLHYHYPLHLQNSTISKYILKEVWSYLSFVLDQPNPVFHKHKPNYLHPSRWSFQAPLFRSFSWLWLFMLLVVFKHLSGHQGKASVTLPFMVLLQEDSRNSVSVYISRDMIWCYMFSR